MLIKDLIAKPKTCRDAAERLQFFLKVLEKSPEGISEELLTRVFAVAWTLEQFGEARVPDLVLKIYGRHMGWEGGFTFAELLGLEGDRQFDDDLEDDEDEPAADEPDDGVAPEDRDLGDLLCLFFAQKTEINALRKRLEKYEPLPKAEADAV